MTRILENINEDGLYSIMMAINDTIQRNMDISEGDGLQVGNNWLTPSECYWLYRLLETQRGTCLVSDTVLDALRNGTENPETLKDW